MTRLQRFAFPFASKLLAKALSLALALSKIPIQSSTEVWDIK